MLTLNAKDLTRDSSSPLITTLPEPPPHIASPVEERFHDKDWLFTAVQKAQAEKDLDAELRYLSALTVHDWRNLQFKLRLVDIHMERHEWDLAYPLMHEITGYFPRNPEFLDRMGAICAFGSRQAESYKWFDHCAEVAPRFDRANWNRSLALLQDGRWGEAWPLYDYGRTPGIGQRRMREVQPVWDGRPLDGKTLYIWWEQGFGDTIMFWRVLWKARERSRCKRMIVEIQADLMPLFAPASNEWMTVVATQEHNNFAYEFDAHCSFVDLMKQEILNVDAPAKFACPPYINPPKGKFPPPLKGKRIGVCWKGNAAHFNDRARSIDADAFMGIAQGQEHTFVSLMPDIHLPTDKGITAEQILIPTFAHAAELIGGCDLVVTVDTAVMHLAGAIGTPTVGLITTDPDWRWGLPKRADDGQIVCDQRTPIYPSLRLIRQKQRLDWSEPLAIAVKAIGEL